MFSPKIFGENFFTVIGLEDDVVGLRVAHDEDQIDDEESKKIFGDHPIDHDYKGTDNLECPSEKNSCSNEDARNLKNRFEP